MEQSLKNSNKMFNRRLIFTALGLIFISSQSQAQQPGLLYDPEPPVDSGYVRIMLTADAPKVSVVVDNKLRVSSLVNGRVSDYMVISSGSHQIDLLTAGKKVASVQLDVIQGTSVTVAFTSLTSLPKVIVDKTSTNRLKAMLSIYHLADKAGTLDILTIDGATKVFSGLEFGKVGAIQVNPISVELIATSFGGKEPLVNTSLVMTQGGAYSVFLLSGKGNKLMAIVERNKIERYSGK